MKQGNFQAGANTKPAPKHTGLIGNIQPVQTSLLTIYKTAGATVARIFACAKAGSIMLVEPAVSTSFFIMKPLSGSISNLQVQSARLNQLQPNLPQIDTKITKTRDKSTKFNLTTIQKVKLGVVACTGTAVVGLAAANANASPKSEYQGLNTNEIKQVQQIQGIPTPKMADQNTYIIGKDGKPGKPGKPVMYANSGQISSDANNGQAPETLNVPIAPKDIVSTEEFFKLSKLDTTRTSAFNKLTLSQQQMILKVFSYGLKGEDLKVKLNEQDTQRLGKFLVMFYAILNDNTEYLKGNKTKFKTGLSIAGAKVQTLLPNEIGTFFFEYGQQIEKGISQLLDIKIEEAKKQGEEAKKRIIEIQENIDRIQEIIDTLNNIKN